jgi:hypothetical protein
MDSGSAINRNDILAAIEHPEPRSRRRKKNRSYLNNSLLGRKPRRMVASSLSPRLRKVATT